MQKTLRLLALTSILAGCASSYQSASLGEPGPYTIIAGDVLQVTVWKEEGLDQEVLVLSDGTVNYPLIGSVEAQGKTPAQLQEEIKDGLGKLIPDASVTVAVKAALRR